MLFLKPRLSHYLAQPSSMRIYNENSKNPLVFKRNEYVRVPVGFAEFPKELPTPPRLYIEKGFNICHWTKMPAGGHFAAVEQPGLLSKDILNFFSNISESYTSFFQFSR